MADRDLDDDHQTDEQIVVDVDADKLAASVIGGADEIVDAADSDAEAVDSLKRYIGGITSELVDVIESEREARRELEDRVDALEETQREVISALPGSVGKLSNVTPLGAFEGQSNRLKRLEERVETIETTTDVDPRLQEMLSPVEKLVVFDDGEDRVAMRITESVRRAMRVHARFTDWVKMGDGGRLELFLSRKEIQTRYNNEYPDDEVRTVQMQRALEKLDEISDDKYTYGKDFVGDDGTKFEGVKREKKMFSDMDVVVEVADAIADHGWDAVDLDEPELE